MATTSYENLIQNLIRSPEQEVVEFKHNNSNPEKLGSWISGLANSACLENKSFGYLIYGISDQRRILGTNLSPHEQKVGNEGVINWLTNSLSPRIDFRVKKLTMDGKNIVIFEVPAATVQPVKFKRVAYIRVGSSTRRLDDVPDKERQIWKNAERYIFEKSITLSGLNGDEVLSYLDFSRYFKLFGLPPVFEKEKVIENFIRENFIISEGAEKFSITSLGSVLFGRDLGKFDRLERKKPRVIVYRGNNRVETLKEKICIEGYAIGFEAMIGYINDQLPINEEIGKTFRKEFKMYPELAIRELVANAIIHQDFSIPGTGPSIEIFEDRIEITNPGVPLVDTMRFLDHPPRSRNEQLASVMRRMNICEERGSGIDKVVKQCEFFQLPAPEFYQGNDYLRVTLYAPKELKDMDKKDKIRACYQHCCLKYVSNEFMTNQSLRERFNIKEQNYAVASRIISDTIDAGWAKNADNTSRSNRYAKYVPFWA